MNFAAFQQWRETQLSENPHFLDCSETNVYRALSHLRPPEISEPSNRTVHRCDVARLWLRRYKYSESFSRKALVCRGVRHALGLIFSELARNNSILWTPAMSIRHIWNWRARHELNHGFFPLCPNRNFHRAQLLGSLNTYSYRILGNRWAGLSRQKNVTN
jgi:hypothetical protein